MSKAVDSKQITHSRPLASSWPALLSADEAPCDSGSATTSPSIPDEFRQRFPVDHPVAPFTRQVQPNSPCGPLQSSAAPADTVPDSHLKAGITKIMKNIIFFT